MPNQHTKKKAEAAKKATNAKKPTTKVSGKKAEEQFKEHLAKAGIRLRSHAGTELPEVLFISPPCQPFATPMMNKCDQKARHQPHFTLLPADNFTPLLVKEWIRLAEQHRVPEEKLAEARSILKNIEQWRTANPTKCHTPD